MRGPENVILCYAKGGLGKSTFGAQLAAYIWKKFGKKTRVVNADGGGTVNAHAPLIEAGISEVWDIDRWDESSMFYTLDCASKGWWPIDVNEPNSPLVAPQRSWKECLACKGDVGAQGFNLPKACKSCKTPLAAGTFCRTKHETTEAFSAVGSVIFEGMSAFGELLLRRLRTVNAEGGRTIMDAGYKISAPGLSHFGDAQTYIAQYVANSKNIPTELVYWTALENKGEDDGKPIYGPKGPGQALTPMCIPWFSDVLHLDAIPRIDRGTTLKDANGVEIVDRKLFLAPHFPSDNKIYAFMAKTSVPLAGKMPSVIDFPADGNTAEKFMTALAEAKRRAAEEMLK